MLKNKFFLTTALMVILVIVGILFWQSTAVKAPGTSENIPGPLEEEALNFEGKIYSTPEGAQFDDYFVSSNGQEYGIEAHTGYPSLKSDINTLKDSGKTIIIKGILLENIIDYGGRQIQVMQIQEKSEKQIGLANPASVYCEKQRGALEIRDMDKGQVGICVFDDGECEEWAYYRGECEPGEFQVVLITCEEFEGADTCIEEYNPVCGRIIGKDGMPEWKEFSNHCLACISNEIISGVIYGKCKNVIR
jgi:putative hemolysin